MRGRALRLVEFTKAFYLGGTEVQVVELLRGLPLHHHVQVAVLDEVGPLLESVWRLGYLPAAFPLRGSAAQPNTALQIGRLACWLREQRIDLVHAHDFYSTLLAVPAAKLVGCRVVVGRLDLAHWYGSARRAALAQLTRMADRVIANAEAIRRMLIHEEHVPPERISVIHNALDLARFDERTRAGLRSTLPDTRGEPVVVHVANMSHPVKRQEDLISAIAQLRREGVELHAFLVGDGPRRPLLEGVVRELGVEDRVHFLGYRMDVPAIYARGTFGVLCSSSEGLSNAVIEGMAARLPMAVTDVGGNPDLIGHDGDRGLLVRPGEPTELASAFLRLLADREAASRMGSRARAFVERELTLPRMVQAHEALYRDVIGAGAAR